MNRTKKHASVRSKLLLAIMCIVMLVTIAIRADAQNMGRNVGNITGKAVGRLMGSIDGMTRGREEGTKAGKVEGLSAEDTAAEISNEFKQVTKLEVLVASVQLSNFHTIGKDQDYAALYLTNGNVVFTVDLSQANVTADKDTLTITIPDPAGTLYIDAKTTEKAAEYQEHYFTGSAEEGFDAYLNTMKAVQSATTDTLTNYDELIEEAKKSAKEQITNLVNAVSINKYQVAVDFSE